MEIITLKNWLQNACMTSSNYLSNLHVVLVIFFFCLLGISAFNQALQYHATLCKLASCNQALLLHRLLLLRTPLTTNALVQSW